MSRNGFPSERFGSKTCSTYRTKRSSRQVFVNSRVERTNLLLGIGRERACLHVVRVARAGFRLGLAEGEWRRVSW